MTGADWIGWAATAVLMATLIRQIRKQWIADSVESVSVWLFVGQIAASVLFIIYSALVSNPVFVVTNVLILGTAVVGQVLTVIKRRRQNATQ
ncbi:PQ-loop domain-containing transporter [Luteimonas sp. YGD11-2]|uniref:PQ-loop domain-containing transporter n=1 Tax=Luteimonas sp. YGD11-2 TaxID=2508168 RepID=UPI00100BB15B|nr:PQ-loop domain-containing transporter [Luteimonas sp. YGD11-2]